MCEMIFFLTKCVCIDILLVELNIEYIFFSTMKDKDTCVHSLQLSSH